MRLTGLLPRRTLVPMLRAARPALRTAALALAALALAACGDCDCAQHKATAGATPAPAPAAPTAAAAEPVAPVVAQRWRGEGSTLEFSAWRMRCAGCEKKIEDTLKALPGVKDALASHGDSKVVVTLAEPALRETLPPRMAAALEAQGFRVLGP
ncbi:MAG: heavy-metal-associated domain-containing protein [Planctomycetia bacterium]